MMLPSSGVTVLALTDIAGHNELHYLARRYSWTITSRDVPPLKKIHELPQELEEEIPLVVRRRDDDDDLNED